MPPSAHMWSMISCSNPLLNNSTRKLRSMVELIAELNATLPAAGVSRALERVSEVCTPGLGPTQLDRSYCGEVGVANS